MKMQVFGVGAWLDTQELLLLILDQSWILMLYKTLNDLSHLLRFDFITITEI